jgi:hypothetical protein
MKLGCCWVVVYMSAQVYVSAQVEVWITVTCSRAETGECYQVLGIVVGISHRRIKAPTYSAASHQIVAWASRISELFCLISSLLFFPPTFPHKKSRLPHCFTRLLLCLVP